MGIACLSITLEKFDIRTNILHNLPSSLQDFAVSFQFTPSYHEYIVIFRHLEFQVFFQ